MPLMRIVVMRNDYPKLRLNMAQSIMHRLSEEGISIRDVISIESSPMKSWEPGEFAIIWVRPASKPNNSCKDPFEDPLWK